MTRSPLFSTYRQGENRVTSSVLAVFERVDVEVVERLLGAATGEATLAMLSFQNQSAKGSDSVPDAVISSSFKFVFEVKTDRNAVRKSQLLSHVKQLDDTHENELMFVLTPDPEEPAVVAELDDPRVIWFNFVALDRAIQDVLEDADQLLSERSRFLLRELRRLFEEDGLLSWDDTVIVAARQAYDEYLKYSAYICQPGRSFKSGLTNLGFYRSGQIEPLVPKIVHVEEVTIDPNCEGPARRLIEQLLEDRSRTRGQPIQVFMLTSPDDPGTTTLEHPILNTSRTASGKPWAWTLGQRYTTLERLLRNPGTTTELDAL